MIAAALLLLLIAALSATPSSCLLSTITTNPQQPTATATTTAAASKNSGSAYQEILTNRLMRRSVQMDIICLKLAAAAQRPKGIGSAKSIMASSKDDDVCRAKIQAPTIIQETKLELNLNYSIGEPATESMN